jgi:hypothetical protein
MAAIRDQKSTSIQKAGICERGDADPGARGLDRPGEEVP